MILVKKSNKPKSKLISETLCNKLVHKQNRNKKSKILKYKTIALMNMKEQHYVDWLFQKQ